MSNKLTIEVPRLDGETPRAYAARVEYLTMGAQRSIDKVAYQKGIKAGSRSSTLLEWSRQFNWVEHAARYDQALAAVAVAEHAEQYRQELEEHRQRYQKAGQALYGVAISMLSQLRAAPVEYTPAALSTIARALTTAGDLEAHALRIADLLPKLDRHDSE